mmetsp:Transcript_108397/g.258686  ORF Transcript_108397/g.258686 Transcript_108397/m.258686 type:complete len:118 (-) Transcript_108397:143-496(-)
MSNPIPGSSVLAVADAPCTVETPTLVFEMISRGVPGDFKVDADETSTVDSSGSDVEKEEIDVQSWSIVGRKIFERLADDDSDDDFDVMKNVPINTHAWSAVGAKIFNTLADFSDDED